MKLYLGYKESVFVFRSKKDWTGADEFLKNPKIREKLCNAFQKIKLIDLNEKYNYAADEYDDDDDYYDEKSVLIQNMDEDEFLEKIYNKELRYNDFKSGDDRFLFYYDLEKEIRSVLVGTTNFLVVDSVCAYEPSKTIWLDDSYKNQNRC